MPTKKASEPVDDIHLFDEPYKDINGKRWYGGCGNQKADIVFVDSWPGDEIKRTNRPLSDRIGKCLQWLLRLADIAPSRCYYTYTVKFPIPTGKKPSATDKALCATVLREEIERINPKVVVAFGSDAWSAVANVRQYPFACCRGEPIWNPSVNGNEYWLFPTFNLPQVMMNGGEGYKDRMELSQIPQHILVHSAVRELKIVKRLADGEDVRATYNSKRPAYDVLTTPEEVDFAHESLLGTFKDGGVLCLDCEWEGRNWLDPNRYIRTVQIGYAYGSALIVKLHEAGGLPSHGDTKAVMQAVKRLLEDPMFGIVGHNVISDGEWLLQEGIDIRNRVIYDTMLGEYLLCEDGPFGLEEAAMKYAPYGRYCSELECWVKQHGKECKLGFGNVPDEILLPYGAADVDCLRYIMDKQIPMISALGYMEPRGTEKEYPSMLQTTLNTQRVVYEIEGTGLPVDKERLNSLIDVFQSKKAELLSQVVLGAAQVGMPNFNPGSAMQVRELLFQKLGLPPVKTTAGKDWAEAVGNWGLDDEIDESPGTDKQTLEILGDAHPLVHALLQFRRVDQYCKTWLRHKDPKNPERGIEGQMWADGRLHSHMSQLSTTSRFKSSSPNCFPKEVEVLTSKGWLHWDEAYARRDEPGMLLAQWDPETPARDITFAKPQNWYGAMADTVHVVAGKQIDVHCTPNHRFMVYNSKTGTHRSVYASELEQYRDWGIPQCGRLVESPGTRHLTDDEITVLCATQADSYINKVPYKGVMSEFGVSYDFSKQRKTDRITAALSRLGIPFKTKRGKTSIGTIRDRTYVGTKHRNRLFTEFKQFNSKLFEFDADTLRRIADEVFLWDGCRVHGVRYNYASAIRANTEWVQAIEVMNGRRARGRVYASKCGNPSYQIDVSNSQFAPLSSVRVVQDTGGQEVYCATMPLGTIVVKSAGNVLFSQNSQNFPKKAEGFLAEIFGKDNVPPVIRTIVVPPEGFVMMEADFQQAELFTIASLSGDQHMIDVLKTPGRDMHTSISAKAFGYHMFDENNKEWTEDDIVELVRDTYGGDAENKEFKTWQKHLVFRDAHGNELTYAQYKAGPRISGKNVNFGILYGRGGADTAIQVKAETGTSESLDVLTAQLDSVIKTWKEVEYPTAWAFIERCMARVNDPGFITNPFGRIRRAPFLLRGQKDAGAERNFANFPIQSTVSDAVQIAMDQMQKWRAEHDMHFEIQNQIHDAVMLHVPKSEIEATKYMFHHTMGNVHIPLKGTDFEHPGGPDYFTLGVDIDVYERWGQKVKE